MLWGIEYRRRPILVEASRQRHAVVLVVHPLLSDGVRDAEHRATENLSSEAARMQYRADIRDAQIVEQGIVPSSTSTSTSAKPATNENGMPAPGYVSRATPMRPCPASCRRAFLVCALMSSGS